MPVWTGSIIDFMSCWIRLKTLLFQILRICRISIWIGWIVKKQRINHLNSQFIQYFNFQISIQINLGLSYISIFFKSYQLIYMKEIIYILIIRQLYTILVKKKYRPADKQFKLLNQMFLIGRPEMMTIFKLCDCICLLIGSSSLSVNTPAEWIRAIDIYYIFETGRNRKDYLKCLTKFGR